MPTYHHGIWLAYLIPKLPKTAIPKIEALVASLPERTADNVVAYLQQLRDKKE